jgi:hypothetical protein
MPAVAGYIGFDTGSFLINASALWQDDDSTVGMADTEYDWVVGVGVIGNLGDMLRIEAAANMGEGYEPAVYGLQTTGPLAADLENDFEYWSASVLAVLSFGNNLSLELDFGYTDLEHEADDLGAAEFADQVVHLWSIGGAIYWDPVDQLTLGWGVGWNKQEDDDGDEFRDITAGFGAWFRF